MIGEQVLRGFFDAFNAGDWERVRAHLPDEATPYPNVIVPGADQDLFRGFFLDGVQAGTPEDLIEWLTERHSLHESWFVQDMVIGGNYRNPQWYGLEVANFGIQFVRRADDLSPYTVIGKGLLNCVDGTLLRLYGGFWFAGVSETSGL